MDLSFTLDGGTLHLGRVQLDDIPRVIDLLRQSFREPPLFPSDGLETLRMLSTEELYERFLSGAEEICCEPIRDTSDMTQPKRLERAYLYRGELYRRTHKLSLYVRAYEEFIYRESKDQALTVQLYNQMTNALSQEYPVVYQEFEDQKRTKGLMREIVRGPLVLSEINDTVRKIMNKTSQNHTKFKHYLTTQQYRLILNGKIEEETLDIQEELLESLQTMFERL